MREDGSSMRDAERSDEANGAAGAGPPAGAAPGERFAAEDFGADYPPLAGDEKNFLATRVVSGGERDTGLGPGAVIDDFRIVREIGRGGMGVVYEAEQISLGRRVALKLVPPGALRNRASFDRFRREALAVARLSHPRIVALHGFNQSGGVAYLAMEYVPGPDLAEIIDRLRTARTHGRRFVRIGGEAPPAGRAGTARAPAADGSGGGAEPNLDLRNYSHFAASIGADAADALAHAHVAGLVHRDIKPSNLILAADGRVKLSDFGLAKSSEDGSLTRSGDFIGSPAYVSPEQASPRRSRADVRSDVYSLGVTLYELVTLHQPFAGKDVAQVLRNIQTLDPPPPSRLDPRVSRDLETIILKAIEKDPDRRYASAAELSADLRRFLNYEPVLARPLSWPARVLRRARRQRTGLTLSVLGASVLVLAALLLIERPASSRRQAEVVRDITAQLARRGGEASAAGVLELFTELSAELSLSERRERIEALTDQARALLDEQQFERVDGLIPLLDAKATLGQWGEVEQALLEIGVRDIKLEFVQRLALSLQAQQSEELPVREWRKRLAALERMLVDRDPQVCRNAAAALGAIGSSASLGALVDALTRREDPRGRIALILALQELGHPGAVPFLTDEAHAEDPWVRFEALSALDALDPPDLDARVAHLADDPNEWLRYRLGEVRERLARRPLK